MGIVIVVMLALSARESWTRLNDRQSHLRRRQYLGLYVHGAEQLARRPLRRRARDLSGRRASATHGPDDQRLSATWRCRRLNSLAAGAGGVGLSRIAIKAVTDLGAEIKRLAELQEKTAAAIAQPKSARPAGLGG